MHKTDTLSGCPPGHYYIAFILRLHWYILYKLGWSAIDESAQMTLRGTCFDLRRLVLAPTHQQLFDLHGEQHRHPQ
jgi:hypothetical protein